jgi:hypothetical protein
LVGPDVSRQRSVALQDDITTTPPEEHGMARLIIEAEGTAGTGASSGVARPGNQLPLYLVVSVTRSSGVPVTGLGAQNVRVNPIIVAPGGALVTISQMIEPEPGTYLIDVVPIPAGTWQLGRYLFWLALTSGTNRGQTVCAVSVD